MSTFILAKKEVAMSKPYRRWKITIKEIWGDILTPELHGPYDLEDVKKHFGLKENDVLWYNIEEIKN